MTRCIVARASVTVVSQCQGTAKRSFYEAVELPSSPSWHTLVSRPASPYWPYEEDGGAGAAMSLSATCNVSCEPQECVEESGIGGGL